MINGIGDAISQKIREFINDIVFLREVGVDFWVSDLLEMIKLGGLNFL